MEKYDVIIVGAGSGGLNVASFMNRVGLKVLLIEKSDSNIGGDCLNYGCVPSKALIYVSRLVACGKKTSRFGILPGEKPDIKKVMKYVKEKQEEIRQHENASYLKKKGISVVLGEAKFSGKREVEVDGKKYFGKKIVLATGSRPRKLEIPGVEKLEYGKEYLDNESIFDIEKLPRRLLVIGGGPIGLELGQAMMRLGSKVTLLQRGSRFLPKEELEIADELYRQLKKEGMEFFFNCSSEKILSKNEAIFKSQNSKKSLKFDAILVGIGRKLNIPEGLSKAKIKLDKGGKIVVDEKLRTTNKHVYVCGDVAGGMQFTHAAELHASVILNNFFSPFKKKLSYDKFSWVTYTDPEIATFGINEEELKKRGIKYEKLFFDVGKEDRELIEESEGKLLLCVSGKKILGGSLIIKNAGEIAQELMLANSAGIDINEIFETTHPYPTASRINRGIISQHLSKKLTRFAKKIMRILYRV